MESTEVLNQLEATRGRAWFAARAVLFSAGGFTLSIVAFLTGLVPFLGIVLGLAAGALAVLALIGGAKRTLPIVALSLSLLSALASTGTTAALLSGSSGPPRALRSEVPSGTLSSPGGTTGTATPGPAAPSDEATSSAEPSTGPTTESSTAPAPVDPGTQTALAALALLRVNDNQSISGYVRDAFAFGSYDFDHDGCDARNDILRRDLTGITVKSGTHGCIVLSGTLSEPYSGVTISFTRSEKTSALVQIDHVVPLKDAWLSGAYSWSAEQLKEFGNDPLNLLAVSGKLNDAKGDSDAADWLPPNTGYRCSYVARQIAVKYSYSLTVRSAERTTMASVLASCPSQGLPSGAKALPAAAVSAPAPAPAAPVAAPSAEAAPAAPVPAPAPSAASQADSGSSGAGNAVYYKNCAEVRAAGKAPLHRGDPGYRDALDRDHDGIACEK